jgi:hypothetical protein
MMHCAAAAAAAAVWVLQMLLPRLQQCENRLAGVANLAGSLMAVDMLAAEVGIIVPHPPLSALTAGMEGLPALDPQQQQQQQQQQSDGHMPLLSMIHGVRQQQQQQQQGSGNVLTLSRQQQLQQQIDEGKQQMVAVQQNLVQLQKQVRRTNSDV